MPRQKRYPWPRWFSQSRFRIERGKHFSCQPHGMAQQIRNASKRHDVSVSISIEGNVIQVKVL